MKSILLSLLVSGPLFAQQTMNLQSHKASQVPSQLETSLRKQQTQSNFQVRSSPEVSVDKFKNKTTDYNEKTSNLKALGGADPGGGGAYKMNGELKTLAEAGAILEKASQLGSKVYPKYYVLKTDAIEALRDIISKLPFYDSSNGIFAKFADEVIGKRDTFIDQNDVSKSEYDKIKSDYRKVIKSTGKKLDEAAFVLVAYGKSDVNKTYILPAFEELSSFQQALILIHEYFMRQSSTYPPAVRLGLVLNLDVIILDILKNGTTDDSKLRFLTAMEKLNAIQKEEVGYYRLALLEKKLGRPIFASELVLEPRRELVLDPITYPESSNKKIDPSLVQKFESQMPGVAQYFENWELIVTSKFYITLDKTAVDLQNAKREAMYKKARPGNQEDLDEKIKELMRAESEYLAHFEQKVKSICQIYNPKSSGVSYDFLISSILVEGHIMEINCKEPILSRNLLLNNTSTIKQ